MFVDYRCLQNILFHNRFNYFLIAMYYICVLVTRSHESCVTTLFQNITRNISNIHTHPKYIFIIYSYIFAYRLFKYAVVSKCITLILNI